MSVVKQVVSNLPTLADTARVTIGPDITNKSGAPLSRDNLRRLQEQRVLALIRDTPAGAHIPAHRFMRELRLNSLTAARTVLRNMERDGKVRSRKLSMRRTSYEIPTNDTVVPTPPSGGLTLTALEIKAQQYSWQHEHAHNDLRRFIEWLKKEEEDE